LYFYWQRISFPDAKNAIELPFCIENGLLLWCLRSGPGRVTTGVWPSSII
jgi:hypothetical protein